MKSATEVQFQVPAPVAFDYLVDPANRPQWQSSLRRVEAVSTATPGVGQTWIDVTTPGMRPFMETTVFEPARKWTERGTWRGIAAELTLVFTPTPGGCTVSAQATVTGRGILRPLGPVITAAAGFAVPGDLRKAAALLADK